MRFLIVSDFICNPDSGAAGTLIACGKALQTLGHEVDYLWHEAKPRRIPHVGLSQLTELPMRQFRQVQKEMASGAPDVVMISQPYAFRIYEKLAPHYPEVLFLNRTHGWEARLNAARRTYHWDGPRSAAHQWISSLVERQTARICIRTARACQGLIVPQTRCAEFIRQSSGISGDKIAVIPYGVDPAFGALPRMTESGSGLRLLYVGNYLPVKGSLEMEAMLPAIGREHSRVQMTFVVPGQSAAEIRRTYIKGFGDRLTVIPWTRREDLMRIYAGHDLFLYPSLFEGFCKTVLEAMASGLCVAGYDEGALSEIAVNGREALFCRTGDRRAFGEILDAALRDPEKVRAIGAAARHKAAGMTWERHAAALVRFCEQRKRARSAA